MHVVEGFHERYAPGPLRLPISGLPLLLVLEPGHVHRVLDGAPDPLSPASTRRSPRVAGSSV